MTRIEREKQIVRKMIELYCRHHLKEDTMPEMYRNLEDYACHRLEHCRYGEQKTACKDCPTLCYSPKEREAIREVMQPQELRESISQKLYEALTRYQ